jgi:hypothetical protein
MTRLPMRHSLLSDDVPEQRQGPCWLTREIQLVLQKLGLQGHISQNIPLIRLDLRRLKSIDISHGLYSNHHLPPSPQW